MQLTYIPIPALLPSSYGASELQYPVANEVQVTCPVMRISQGLTCTAWPSQRGISVKECSYSRIHSCG